ncbi:unnamed protein product [Boreogadus saida]
MCTLVSQALDSRLLIKVDTSAGGCSVHPADVLEGKSAMLLGMSQWNSNDLVEQIETLGHMEDQAHGDPRHAKKKSSQNRVGGGEPGGGNKKKCLEACNGEDPQVAGIGEDEGEVEGGPLLEGLEGLESGTPREGKVEGGPLLEGLEGGTPLEVKVEGGPLLEG